jgi:DNA-binding NtrC family response regulator
MATTAGWGRRPEAHADVRVVAATNRRLEDEIKAGRFREDLYYRLNVISIHLPALREHRQDIPELVEHFLTTRQLGPLRYQVEPAALKALVGYDWPGNVRELANVLERAQILAEDHRITTDDLPEALVSYTAAGAGDGGEPTQELHQVERRHLVAVLREAQGNKVHAARALGISRRALYRLLDKYHLREQAETDQE